MRTEEPEREEPGQEEGIEDTMISDETAIEEKSDDAQNDIDSDGFITVVRKTRQRENSKTVKKTVARDKGVSRVSFSRNNPVS